MFGKLQNMFFLVSVVCSSIGWLIFLVFCICSPNEKSFSVSAFSLNNKQLKEHLGFAAKTTCPWNVQQQDQTENTGNQKGLQLTKHCVCMLYCWCCLASLFLFLF